MLKTQKAYLLIRRIMLEESCVEIPMRVFLDFELAEDARLNAHVSSEAQKVLGVRCSHILRGVDLVTGSLDGDMTPKQEDVSTTAS